VSAGFQPPPYPYDRLEPLKEKAAAHEGGVVDLSIGTPCDPPPPEVVAALSSSNAERGYPASIGTPVLRNAAASWIEKRFGIDIPPNAVAACVGTKEFVATTPQWLKLRTPDKDTVLYPEISYPTYEMGAILAGLRPVAVPVDDQWRLDLSAIDPSDAKRALCLWVNSPGNPAGNLDDLGAAASWGRERGVLVLSDECYVEFTWNGEPSTILSDGLEGVVAAHSLSKRSNLAGVRAGFYAGDPDVVHYLGEVRKHAGFMVPGPVQAAAAVALGDQEHVEVQRDRYRSRLQRMRDLLVEPYGIDAPMPGGAFYLWVPAPEGDAWGFAERLAADAGILVSPGEFYGPAGASYVRIAVVQPDDKLDLVEKRLRALT
jgi:succinyldiaminopimelate transaminase